MKTKTRIHGPSISPDITRRRWFEKHIKFANQELERHYEGVSILDDPHQWEIWRMHLETFFEFGSEEELDKLYCGVVNVN